MGIDCLLYFGGDLFALLENGFQAVDTAWQRGVRRGGVENSDGPGGLAARQADSGGRMHGLPITGDAPIDTVDRLRPAAGLCVASLSNRLRGSGSPSCGGLSCGRSPVAFRSTAWCPHCARVRTGNYP
ncbi:hypothetical protein GCM10022243_62380 [Saccharothrix violaceirubra]